MRPVKTGRHRALPTGATHAERSLIGFSSSPALWCWIWWIEFSELCSVSTINDVLIAGWFGWPSNRFLIGFHLYSLFQGTQKWLRLLCIVMPWSLRLNFFFLLIMFTWNIFVLLRCKSVSVCTVCNTTSYYYQSLIVSNVHKEMNTGKWLSCLEANFTHKWFPGENFLRDRGSIEECDLLFAGMELISKFFSVSIRLKKCTENILIAL